MILLRSLLFQVWLYVGSALIALAMLPVLVLPRPATRACLSVWGGTMSLGLRLICGVRYEVRGRQHLPDGAALIAGKHQGMFDTVAPFAFLPDVCFVLKKELLAIPFYGWYAVRARMIAVDREGHAKALKQLVTDTQDRLREARQVLIFPEGTRTAPGAAPDYKPGVAALYRDLGMACTPMATNSGLHWPARGIIRRPGVVVFEFLEPIPAGLKRGVFMQTLQERIETATAALIAADPARV